MGQCSQIIIQLPKQKNSISPDKTHLIVYHNQWLFGKGFLRNAQRLLFAIKHQLENKHHRQIIDIVENAILHANSADLDYMTNSYVLNQDEYVKDYLYFNKLFNKCKKEKYNFLNCFGNDDGYLFIKIDDNDKIKYSILTTDKKQVTPKEYLNEYYKDSEVDDIEFYKTIEYLNSFDSYDFSKLKRIS